MVSAKHRCSCVLFSSILLGTLAIQLGAEQPIKTTREIRLLSPEEARRAYPVEVHGVVTYFDPQFGYLFIHDNSGAIYVDATHLVPGLSVQAGDVLEVQGVSGAGLFAPVLDRPHIKVVGNGPIPKAEDTNFDQLLSGFDDGRWVSLDGIVRSAVFAKGYSTLTLVRGKVRFDVIMPGKQEGLESWWMPG